MSSGRSVEGAAGGGAVGRGLAVGVAVRPLLDVLSGLHGFVEGVDPGQVPARDAVDLVRVLDRIGRVADAAKAAAAGRVAESSLWSKAGHRSPAHWVARVKRPRFLPLSYGLRLSVEGRVVGLLVLGGGEVAEATVQAPVVVPVDPAGGGVLDVADGPVGAGVEDGGADALGLVQPDHALHQRVVVGVPDAPDRWTDALEVQVVGEPDRRVLRACVSVADQFAGHDRPALALTLPGRHAQRRHHQVESLAGCGVPGDDLLSEHVDDERHVDEPRPRPAVREVHDPAAVGGGRGEVAVQQVACPATVAAGIVVRTPFGSPDPLQTKGSHRPIHCRRGWRRATSGAPTETIFRRP